MHKGEENLVVFFTYNAFIYESADEDENKVFIASLRGSSVMEARSMILFLHGQDTYRSRQKLNEIIEHYKKIHKSGLNLTRLNLKEDSFENFRDKIETISMFKEKKLIILENAFSGQDFIENFLKYKKDFGDNLILFFEEKITDTQNSLFKFLAKNSKSQEFNLLEDEKLKNWIKKEFQKYKVEAELKATQTLIDFVGNDLWQLSNEIKKLVSYRAPRQRGESGKENEVLFDHKKEVKIELRDVELLVKPKIETDIFKTIDAIAQKNKKQALSLIHEHLEKGDSPLYLLSMINFQFRNILQVADFVEKGYPYYAILKQSKLHPYIVKKSYSQAKKFSLGELKKIYQKIFQVDLNIKTGRIDPQTGLDILIAEI